MDKRTGQVRLPTTGETGKKKVTYVVILGNDKSKEQFKSKANASKYMSQNMPYFGTASMTRVKETSSGKTIVAAKKRNDIIGPKMITPYAQSRQQWIAHPEWKQQYKGNLGGASRDIAATWKTYKAQNGITTAPKKVSSGTGDAWILYARMNGGMQNASSSWNSMSTAQKLQFYQTNKGNAPPVKTRSLKPRSTYAIPVRNKSK